MSKLIDLSLVVAYVRAAGAHAHLDDTGGGCLTIYAGPCDVHFEGEMRFRVCAGPGWHEGSGARAAPADFYIGPDDDGLGDAPAYRPTAEDTERTLADRIVAMVRS